MIMAAEPTGQEDLLRRLAPQVLAALVRRYGNFEACEDAVQEALLAATQQWPQGGLPDKPLSWLIRIASRRLIDELRSEQSRRSRESRIAAQEVSDPPEHDPQAQDQPGRDDTLILLFLCCHPALTPASQVALTLRAVGGLTTTEIAASFLVPETTMAQRISRAKQRIKATGAEFTMPDDHERDERIQAVLQVLYLIFNEGYTSSSGPDLQRSDLTQEAIRLTREVCRLLPTDGEVAGLLALMLLIDARRLARTAGDGTLIPIAEQDRGRWNQEAIAEGIALVSDALSNRRVGPFQVQAAIAAVHAEAHRAEDTDWPQILALYGLLEQLTPNPMVTLSHAVAAAMVDGPGAGLRMLEPLDADDRMTRNHRLHAVRAHLLEMAGDHQAAATYYRKAARLTTSLPEQRYLNSRANSPTEG